MTTTYGQKGGEGPTRGKTAAIYEATLSPWQGGHVVRKRTFRVTTPTAIATGFMSGGKPRIVVWAGEPVWEGDFGRLVARRVDRQP